VAGALVTLGGVFLRAGQPERATRLLAAGRALGDAIGVVPIGVVPMANNDYFQHFRAEARQRLDEQVFASAWAAGWRLSPEEALADVLAEPDPFTRPLAKVADNLAGLTPREREVLRLVAEGHSNQRIADILFISVPTVKSHLNSVLGKLGVPSRSAATAYAHTHGLL
jgi:DNA-binding CsgD family transcriptional regulator